MLPQVVGTGRLDPRVNRLLAALDPQVFSHLLAFLEPVELHSGQVVNGPRGTLTHVYFPVDSIIARIFVMRDGHCAEFALTGREGVFGIALFLGGDVTPNRSVVLCGGTAYRVHASVIMDLFGSNLVVRALMLRYTQSLIVQMSLTAVCYRHHSIDQQVCRWILMIADRIEAPVLEMTHETMANMLGVRREGVTEAAGRLQKAGLIGHRRGQIWIMDRAAIEARACECYQVIREEEARLAVDTQRC